MYKSIRHSTAFSNISKLSFFHLTFYLHMKWYAIYSLVIILDYFFETKTRMSMWRSYQPIAGQHHKTGIYCPSNVMETPSISLYNIWHPRISAVGLIDCVVENFSLPFIKNANRNFKVYNISTTYQFIITKTGVGAKVLSLVRGWRSKMTGKWRHCACVQMALS